MSAPDRASRALPSAALFLICALVSVVSTTEAQVNPPRGTRAERTLPEIFSMSNAAYFRGDYPAAIRGYESLLELGIDDPDVYFNLGISYARAGRCGAAMVQFERTLRLAPGDRGAENGIAICRTNLTQRRAELRGEAVLEERPSLLSGLVRAFSEQTLAWAMLLIHSFFFGSLLALRLIRGESARTAFAVSAPILGLLLIASAGLLLAKRGAFEDGRPAIVLRENAELREGPDPRARVRAKVLEGERARIFGRSSGFIDLQTSTGQRGWVDARDVAGI